MKYEQKSFTECYGSQEYRDGWQRTFAGTNNNLDLEEGVTHNDDGTYNVEIDIPDDLAKVVDDLAKKNNVSFEVQAGKMVEEGLKIMMENEKEDK